MRRFLASIALAATLVPSSAHALFSDVSPEHPYADAIDYLISEGVLRGYPEDRTFRPENLVNRAEFLHVIMQLVFSEEIRKECLEEYRSDGSLLHQIDLKDVDYSEWYGSSLCVALVSEIVQGYPDKRFRPADSITFAEAAKIIVSALGLSNIYNHHESVSHGPWYEPYVRDLADRNAIPYSIASLHARINRGEMAEILYRVLTEDLRPASGSLTYEHLEHDAPRLPYTNSIFGFQLTYPRVWPAPYETRGATLAYGLPREPSSLRVHLGPLEDRCAGYGQCLSYPFTVDAYTHLNMPRFLQNLADSDTATLFQRIDTGETLTLFYEEKDDGCTHLRALIVSPQVFLRLSGHCTVGDTNKMVLFDHLLRSISFLKPTS